MFNGFCCNFCCSVLLQCKWQQVAPGCEALDIAKTAGSEGRTPLDPVGVSMVSSRTLLFMKPSHGVSALAAALAAAEGQVGGDPEVADDVQRGIMA